MQKVVLGSIIKTVEQLSNGAQSGTLPRFIRAVDQMKTRPQIQSHVGESTKRQQVELRDPHTDFVLLAPRP